jgi:hypothetical protein
MLSALETRKLGIWFDRMTQAADNALVTDDNQL